MTYITENIIAMGFPGGDLSSGLFGYIEVYLDTQPVLTLMLNQSSDIIQLSKGRIVLQGFYRNHMEEVIKFFETHHKVT